MLLKPLGLLKTKLQQLRNTRISSKTRIFTINCIIFWDFLMLYQTLLSPQVKRCAIITYKHGIYELPQELPNDLGNQKISGERLFTWNVVSLKYFVTGCKIWFCFIFVVWVKCSHKNEKYWFWKSLKYFNIYW